MVRPSSALLVASLAGTALAQTVFVDMNVPGGAGDGVPGTPYAAASNVIGTWNAVTPSGAPGGTTVSLLNSDFSNTGVTLKHFASVGGSSAASGTGDFSRLMADYAAGYGTGGNAWMEFSGLQPGLYRVWVYSGLPMSLASFQDGATTIYHKNFLTMGINGFALANSMTTGFVSAGTFARTKNFEVFGVYVQSPQQKLQVFAACDPLYAVARTALNGVQLEKFKGTRIYVNDNATGSGNGHSWPDAMPSLREALELAAMSHGQVEEIWVASGVYRPGQSRTDAFRIPNGLELYGGFAGTESALEERTLATGGSVLTGEIGDPTDTTDNCYHVVDASNTDSSTVLDGFSIGYACANGAGDQARGGGMLGNECDIRVKNCRFGWNYASIEGGGVHVSGDSRASFVRCEFTNNQAGSFGGALRTTSTTQVGVVNSVFLHNSAGLNGGAINSTGARIVASGCVFNANSASLNAGAVYVFGPGAGSRFRNCTLVANHAQTWGGIGIANGAQTDTMNCIAWANHDSDPATSLEQAQIGGSVGTDLFVADTLLQGADPANTRRNFSASPLFVDMNGPDDIQGNSDDNLHLLSRSPAIDSGNNYAAPTDEYDLDGDLASTEPQPFDLDWNPRFVDTPRPDTGIGGSPMIDRGAYEYQPSGFCTADFNGDQVVDFFDYLDFVAAFDAGDAAADMNWDETVDFVDYLDFAAALDAGC